MQRSGSLVRLNVQLIDAYTEKHVWAEIYDRRLSPDNQFALQNEIATKVAAALNNSRAIGGTDPAGSRSNFGPAMTARQGQFT